MKKIFIIIIILFITGCGSKKMICNLDVDNGDQGYQLSSKYVIHYRNNYVQKVEITETYSSQNSSILDYFGKYLKTTSHNFKNNYGNIEYSQVKKNKSLIYKANINYSKIDVKKLIENNDISKDQVKNNMIMISGMKETYESKGAICH